MTNNTMYFLNDLTDADAIFGDQQPVCLDHAEVARLSAEWDRDLFEIMHEADADEIETWGTYTTDPATAEPMRPAVLQQKLVDIIDAALTKEARKAVRKATGHSADLRTRIPRSCTKDLWWYLDSHSAEIFGNEFKALTPVPTDDNWVDNWLAYERAIYHAVDVIRG